MTSKKYLKEELDDARQKIADLTFDNADLSSEIDRLNSRVAHVVQERIAWEELALKRVKVEYRIIPDHIADCTDEVIDPKIIYSVEQSSYQYWDEKVEKYWKTLSKFTTKAKAEDYLRKMKQRQAIIDKD